MTKIILLLAAFTLGCGSYADDKKKDTTAAPATAHRTHDAHSHKHGKTCGHKEEKHGDHSDYEHDGHHHKSHSEHTDECDGPHKS